MRYHHAHSVWCVCVWGGGGEHTYAYVHFLSFKQLHCFHKTWYEHDTTGGYPKTIIFHFIQLEIIT